MGLRSFHKKHKPNFRLALVRPGTPQSLYFYSTKVIYFKIANKLINIFVNNYLIINEYTTRASIRKSIS
jgi:hypothetical protein